MPPQRCCCCNRSVQYKRSRNASLNDKQKAQGLGLLKLHEAIKICHTCRITIHKCPPQDHLSSGQPAALDQLGNSPAASHQQFRTPAPVTSQPQPKPPEKRSALSSRINWAHMTPAEQKDQAETAKKALKAEKRKTGRLLTQKKLAEVDHQLMKEQRQHEMVQLANLQIRCRELEEQVADVSSMTMVC